MEQKWLVGIVVVLLVALAGTSGYVLADRDNEKNKITNDPYGSQYNSVNDGDTTSNPESTGSQTMDSDFEERREIVGYRVTHMLSVTTSDTDGVGKLIDTAVESGANEIGNIVFTFSEERSNELETLAREKAGEDARSKAEAIANSLDVEITGVSSVSEGYPSYPRSYPAYDGQNMAIEDSTSIVSPTNLEKVINLNVVFTINSSGDNASVEHTLSVTGIGSAEETPDSVQMQIGVITEVSEDVGSEEALSRNTTAVNKVIESLKNEGISDEDVETSRFDFSIQRDYVKY